MKCPNCKDVNLIMSERSSVEIDYCPECRGIWLDRGELDKIIDRSNSYEKVDVQKEIKKESYNPKTLNEKYPKKEKKRESLFGEIFDIFGD